VGSCNYKHFFTFLSFLLHAHYIPNVAKKVYEISAILTTNRQPLFLEEPSWMTLKWLYLSNQSSDPLPVWF